MIGYGLVGSKTEFVDIVIGLQRFLQKMHMPEQLAPYIATKHYLEITR